MKRSYRIVFPIILLLFHCIYAKQTASSMVKDVWEAAVVAQTEDVAEEDTFSDNETTDKTDTKIANRQHTVITFSLFVVILLIIIVAIVLVLILRRLRDLSRE